MNDLTKTCSSLKGGMFATDRRTRCQCPGRISRSVKTGDYVQLFDWIEREMPWCFQPYNDHAKTWTALLYRVQTHLFSATRLLVSTC